MGWAGKFALTKFCASSIVCGGACVDVYSVLQFSKFLQCKVSCALGMPICIQLDNYRTLQV